LDLPALPLELAPEQLGDLRIDVAQSGGAQVLKGFLGNVHVGAPDSVTQMLLGDQAGNPFQRLRGRDRALAENLWLVASEVDHRRGDAGKLAAVHRNRT